MVQPGIPGGLPLSPKPLSQILVPGTKIPVDAAIGYGAAICTEILNVGVITDPKIQAGLHVAALVLTAIAHALQTDGL